MSCGSIDAQQTLFHQNYLHTCQWLDNADMHMYATFDPNIPGGSKVMSILLTDHARKDTHTHSDYSAHMRVVQFSSVVASKSKRILNALILS